MCRLCLKFDGDVLHVYIFLHVLSICEEHIKHFDCIQLA